jgi:hypothetical protein
MLQALMLAALLIQDPKSAAKTVEDRLKELDEKLSSLEKKQKSLADENTVLEKRLSDGKEAREKALRQTAAAWVKRYAAVGLSEKQSVDLEELWIAWMKEDQEKPSDLARWKAREDLLRGRLTPEQIPLFGRKVREELEANAKRSVSMVGQLAKLSPDTAAALATAAQGRLVFEEGILLVQAHPEKSNVWSQVLVAVESSLPGLSPSLTAEEQKSLGDLLGNWKTRR